MDITITSYSEFRHPTSTPGLECLGASDGQNMRSKAFPAGMSTSGSQRPAPLQLLARGYPARRAPRMALKLARGDAIGGDDE
jgi:hypothetical protein